MPNYLYTTEVGTKRRRAKSINISNPISLQDWSPSITFIEEDRIILIDGEEFIDAGILPVAITKDKYTKLYPQFNKETGEVIGEARTGLDILMTMFDLLGDVYITEAMERDGLTQ